MEFLRHLSLVASFKVDLDSSVKQNTHIRKNSVVLNVFPYKHCPIIFLCFKSTIYLKGKFGKKLKFDVL